MARRNKSQRPKREPIKSELVEVRGHTVRHMGFQVLSFVSLSFMAKRHVGVDLLSGLMSGDDVRNVPIELPAWQREVSGWTFDELESARAEATKRAKEEMIKANNNLDIDLHHCHFFDLLVSVLEIDGQMMESRVPLSRSVDYVNGELIGEFEIELLKQQGRDLPRGISGAVRSIFGLIHPTHSSMRALPVKGSADWKNGPEKLIEASIEQMQQEVH